MRRAFRSQFVRAITVGFLAAILVFALGLIQYELTTTWFAGAGVAALFSTALGWLAFEPNEPYHPGAGREDRGFNYVRGEGGGGGGG